MLACLVVGGSAVAIVDEAPAEQVAAPSTAATSPATTQAFYSVDLSRFDESLHAPLEAFSTWVSHLATSEVDEAVAMMPIAPRADANANRRACRNISRQFQRPAARPAVIAARVSGNTAVLILVHNPETAHKAMVRRLYLLRRDDKWQIVGFNVAVVVDIYSDDEFKALQESEAWAFQREQSLQPGS
jgi:hypothetical protein